MSNSLRFFILVVSLFLFLVIFLILKRGRIPLKYAIVWFLPTTLLFLLAIVPDTLWKLTEYVGFETSSNFIIGLLLLFLFFICISLFVIVSGQTTKITLLVQEISILKKKIEDFEKVDNNK